MHSELFCISICFGYTFYSYFPTDKYQEDTKRDILLSSACTEKLVLAVSVIEGLCTALKSGGITVRKLRELQKYKEKMVTIVDSIKYAEYTGKLVSDLIKLRCKEVIDIENKAALVTTLTSACHFLPGGKFFFNYSILV